MGIKQAGTFPEQQGTSVAGPGQQREEESERRTDGMWAT